MSYCRQPLKIVLPPRSCPDSGAYTASNANITGEGVFFQQSGNEFQFYGITNEDGYLTVTLDAVNKVIVVGLDEDLVNGIIPDATETTKGKAELATQAETNAGTDDTRIVTPLKLATRVATTSITGLVELATSAESIAGVDTTRAVVPSGLKAATDLINTPLVSANAVATAATTPTYQGQLLFQNDTKVLYASNSTTMGDFGYAALPLSGDVDSVSTNISTGTLSIAATAELDVEGILAFTTGNTVIQIDASPMTAEALLGTTNTAGIPVAYPIDSFLSNYNTAVYTIGSYTTSRSIASAASVTLEQLADFVMTLVKDDLANTVKPTNSP